MRAYSIEAFGEEGRVREMELPEPSAAEVRIKVSAASVNPVDWKLGKGYLKDYFEHRFPFVAGQDFAGVVDAVGTGVTNLQVGDEVFGGHGQPFMGRGTHAEYVIAAADAVAASPAGLAAHEIASIPLAATTAMMCVEAARAGSGQTVLILGAAGGVGSFAVQLAAAGGADVIAVARNSNHEYLRGLGASHSIDYTEAMVTEAVRAIHAQPLDAIIDLVSDADGLRQLSALLRDGGVLASPAAPPPMDDPRITGAFIVAAITRDRLHQLSSKVADGTVSPPAIRTYPLAETGSAFAESQAGHVRGKLVITT